MAKHPPELPPPPAGSKINVTVRPPPAGNVGGGNRRGPFIDVKGGLKTFAKTNSAIGQVKSLVNQVKNIHSIADVASAVKNAAALAKKMGLLGGNLRAKGSVTKRWGESDRPSVPDTTPKARANASAFSIDKLRSKINSDGLARASRFKVQFIAPEALKEHLSKFDDITLMCEQAEFPGRSFNTSDSRIYGPIFKTPHLSTYQEVNFTILCDQNLTEKYVFDLWMDYINPSMNASGINGGGFDFEYRDNYTSTVKLRQYADTGDQTYGCDLIEAYPISVAPLSSSWQDDQFHKVQVTMCYRYWTESDVALPNATSSRAPKPSFAGGTRGAIATAQDKVKSRAAAEISSIKSKAALPTDITKFNF